MATSPVDLPKIKSARKLDPLDLYDVRGLLSDEERMVQDSVARMVDEKVLPIIQHHFARRISRRGCRAWPPGK